MKLSARNALPGTVQGVTKGAVNAEVSLSLAGGEIVTAIITNSSADTLELENGKTAFAVIKASEVMIGKEMDVARLSARNILPGEVTGLTDGAVNSEVIIRLHGGTKIVASITKQSVRALELKVGDKVSAVIKASNVLVGV
jgi:molybdate transport system regulatory protein